jgi:hypothetical protein
MTAMVHHGGGGCERYFFSCRIDFYWFKLLLFCSGYGTLLIIITMAGFGSSCDVEFRSVRPEAPVDTDDIIMRGE